MQQATTLIPDKQARSLFGMMVARAQERDSEFHLPISQTVKLSIDMSVNHESDCISEVKQLRSAGWIDRADDGGWLLSPGGVVL